MSEQARTAKLLPDWRGWVVSLVIVLGIAAALLAMGRSPICECGTVELFHVLVRSPESSQHLADWYSISHVVHGILFYGLAHLLWRLFGAVGGHPAIWALPVAVAFEGLWELLENSPAIVAGYRDTAGGFGFDGDSVINSLADIGWMVLGFVIASALPVETSVLVVVVFELGTLALIRDNLTLKLVTLVVPTEVVREWQAVQPGLVEYYTADDATWGESEPDDPDWAETEP